MIRPVFFLFFLCILCASPLVFGDLSDCFWGGSNEETAYSPTYMPGMGGVTLAQYRQPSTNLGAPQPAIPVQATHNTQAVHVPQTNMPTITIPAGPVGSVGQPATSYGITPQAMPGAEIVYILSASLPSNAEIVVDGVKTIPAAEAKIVSPDTPGAIPATLKTVTVRKPKVEYHWTYAPIVNKTETSVQVVDSRTGRVVRTYRREDADSTILPWLHRREVITYETVEAKVAVPVSAAPSVSSATNTLIQGLP